MSRKKKVKRLVKAQGRADKAVAKAWRARARLSRAEFDRVAPGLPGSMVKAARVNPFDEFLARRAAGGDAGARDLLQKRAADTDPRYRRYLERTVKSAQSGEVKAAAAGELARLARDVPPTPSAQPPKWRITAW